MFDSIKQPRKGEQLTLLSKCRPSRPLLEICHFKVFEWFPMASSKTLTQDVRIGEKAVHRDKEMRIAIPVHFKFYIA